MTYRAMDIGQTGMLAAGDQLEVLANNVANTQTPGFRRQDVAFVDLIYNLLRFGPVSSVSSSPLSLQIGLGTRVGATPTDFTTGPMLTTDLPMDLAINGEGFFRVTDPDGKILYTRNGSFQPKTENATGPVHLQLSGISYPLDPLLTLTGDPGPLSVDLTGVVTQGSTVVGQIQLARFRNPQGLIQVGDTLFEEGVNSGTEITGTPNTEPFGSITSGALEGSNVNLANELVDLIRAGQLFSFNSRSFDTGNSVLQTTLEIA